VAVTLTSITRENGTNCDHLILSVDDNGTAREKKISRQEILNFDFDDANYKLSLVVLWIRYQFQQNNRTFNQIVNALPQVVVS
jgi:hypothetical protein